jgi:alpha-2-macroglobulin
MLTLVRVGALGAVLALASVPALAGDKPFARGDLADSAVKLEAQIKSEARTVTKPIAALPREADAAFERRDARTGMQILSQIAAMAPNDSGNWLRLARAILKIAPTTEAERTVLIERAATAAFIAYQRAKAPAEEADSLVILGRTFADRKLWRPALDAFRLSLELREGAEVRALYERLRDEHGFRILDYSVDAEPASPRVCFEFSEALAGKRTDFSPFVTVLGQQNPALSTDEKQLCIDGLKHGESYTLTLRAGLPSAVHEGLTKSAQFNVYVRDRAPFVHFTGTGYVLPRSGQRGIPIVSVNTNLVAVEIYRVGDRNLVETVLGSDFKHNLYRYDVERLRAEQGSQVWKGDLEVELRLNTDITTAFAVEQAVGALAPGVYVMVAQPTGPAADGALATQWFIVSDLGLTAYSGADGVTAFVHSLTTTEMKDGSSVRLIARNNEVLSNRTTNAAGVAHFEAGLVRGEGGLAPAMLIAEDRGDYAFLSLKAPAFDLSDRGVSGRLVPAGLDAFVYTERGVYRTGETVNITTLLRDPHGVAALGVALTLIVERPDGVEYRRAVVADQGIGGRSLSVPIVNSASTGTWRVRVFTDPKLPSIGQTTFMVEDYVPDRLDVELTPVTPIMSKSVPVEVAVNGRYLYGAPASGLELAADISVAAAKERPGFAGYHFGLGDEAINPLRQSVENLPQTDAQGKARFSVSLEELPATSQPLEARITVTMSDPGGRPVERTLTLPVRPAGDMVGVKPLFNGSSLQEGEKASFDIIVVAPDGANVSTAGLHWQLLKIESRYQWYRQDGAWQFEPVKTTSRVVDGDVDMPSDKLGHLELPVSWGRYRLEVASHDPNGPMTSVTFDAGWYAEASSDTPDLLEVALDKNGYRPGDTMNLAVTARTPGKVTVAVIGERLFTTTAVDVAPGPARISLTVGNDWGTGAYIVATLRRPLDTTANRMPARAIGVRWFAIDRDAHTLALEMNLPTAIRPRQELRIPVRVGKLAPGEEARVIVAAVDLGILNLTNYKAPAPDDYYLGQRRLSAELRDLYGQLIDGMHGSQGEIRTGGDVAAGELNGSPPTQPPLALYSGLVRIGENGTAEVAFSIPDFAGTVRVMAIAWSKDQVGHAVGDVLVRDPVVLTATLPRYLLIGDRSSVRLDLDNVEGPAGDYRVEVTSEGALLTDAVPRTLNLTAAQRAALSFTLNASGIGAGALAVHVSGPEGLELRRSYALSVKPSTQVLARRTVKPLDAGESLTLSSDLLTDLVPGTGLVSVSIASSSALDAASLLQRLERYPFGCSEQIASRALSLLYVNELATGAQLALDTGVDQSIRDSIDRLLARQGSNGSFGLWSVGGEDTWLDAYITDFLTRARDRGFGVPDIALKLALDRLRNYVATANDLSKQGDDLAYVLYVLARNRLVPLGDLRYIADGKLGELKTPIAKAQIAAALDLVGDRVRAEKVYTTVLQAALSEPRPEIGRADFGSALRDAAALVALAFESGAPRSTMVRGVERIEAARNIGRPTSTQEDAWLILAARALLKEGALVAVSVAGQRQQGAFYRSFGASDLRTGLTLTNSGEGRVQAVVAVSGAPVVAEPATERGFKIERLYYSLDGEPADPARTRQNQRLVVVLRMTEAQPQFGRVIAVDYLPAGFEIDNPHLVASGETGAMSWIKDTVAPVSAEFRDDRFSAAFTRSAEDRPVFTVAYVIRAVSPGRYVLPQAAVEDMYRPDRFGRTGSGVVEVSAAR